MPTAIVIRQFLAALQVIAVVPLLVLNSPVPVSAAPESLGELESTVRAEIEGKPGVYAVAFQDLSTGEKILIHADARTHAASLMKVPVMMTAFHLAGQGGLDLERPVIVKNTFASLVDGSPFEVPFDPDGPLAAKAGETLPLIELVKLMITRSDNVATNLVMEFAGADRVMELLGRLGIEGLLVRRGVEDNKAYEAGLNNETSAEGMLAAMAACRDSEIFSEQSRRRMLEILEGQEFTSMISRGVPSDSGALIAHKTGSISWVEHDAGIVQLPGGRAYGLVILTWNFGEAREQATATGAAISALIYRYVSGN